MSASTSGPAAWLESRFDRAVRLRASREDILRRLATTSDPHRRALLRLHLDSTTVALTRLGVTE